MPTTMNVLFSARRPEEQELLVGVRDYANDHELDWDVLPLFSDRSQKERVQNTQPPAALIGRCRKQLADRRQAGVSWVEWIHEGFDLQGDGGVSFDSASIGRVAAEYLLQAGARTLAIRGRGEKKNKTRWQRLTAFLNAAQELGTPGHVIVPDDLKGSINTERFLTFCRSMPQPIGIFTYHDQVAHSYMDELLDAGLKIPEDVMLLGGSMNAESVATRIPLSTIRLPLRALGRAAATQAHRLLSGSKAEVISVPALGVIERASTIPQRHASDALISRALKRVARTDRPIPSVSELATYCRVPRQRLHAHFRAALATSPRAWLEERTMQRAAHLLTTTDLSLAAIAKRCGIAQTTNFSARFKRRFAIPPGKYRSCGA